MGDFIAANMCLNNQGLILDHSLFNSLYFNICKVLQDICYKTGVLGKILLQNLNGILSTLS